MKPSLSWCNNCKENSVLIKAYLSKNEKERQVRRVMYCINRGCDYSQQLPPIPTHINSDSTKESVEIDG